MYIEFEWDGQEFKIPAKFAVCPTCDGKGTRVNPAVDGNGLTSEDFDELGEDFRENYFGGLYDIKCSECNGIRVVKVVNRHMAEKEELAAYDKYLDEEYMIAQEETMERRYGF